MKWSTAKNRPPVARWMYAQGCCGPKSDDLRAIIVSPNASFILSTLACFHCRNLFHSSIAPDCFRRKKVHPHHLFIPAIRRASGHKSLWRGLVSSWSLTRTVIRSPCRTLSGRGRLERIGWNSRLLLFLCSRNSQPFFSNERFHSSFFASRGLSSSHPAVPATTFYRRPYPLHGCRSPPSQHVHHACDPLLPLRGSTLVLLLTEISPYSQ